MHFYKEGFFFYQWIPITKYDSIVICLWLIGKIYKFLEVEWRKLRLKENLKSLWMMHGRRQILLFNELVLFLAVLIECKYSQKRITVHAEDITSMVTNGVKHFIYITKSKRWWPREISFLHRCKRFGKKILQVSINSNHSIKYWVCRFELITKYSWKAQKTHLTLCRPEFIYWVPSICSEPRKLELS